MIRCPALHASDLASVRDRLRHVGYAAAVRRLCPDVPVAYYRRAMRDLRDVPRPGDLDDLAWHAVSLLFLGRPLAVAAARALLGAQLEPLVALGLLAIEGDDVRCDRSGLVPIHDGLFLVSRLAHSRSEPGANAAYLGFDTIELIDEILAARGSVLEVGSGPGIVGILAKQADAGRRVVGTDLCEEAVEIARVNAALNGVSYDVRLGDAYEPAGDDRFDLVLADPPSVAVPDAFAFPLYGQGGKTGDRLLRRIVAGAERHLMPGGRLFAVTELQCVPGDVPFLRWLERWCRRQPGRWARAELIASRHLPPHYHQSLGDHLALMPGSAGTPKVGVELAAYAAARQLYFGYWVRVRTGYTPDAASRCEIHWRFPRATARSRVAAASDARTLTAKIERMYQHDASGFDPAFRWFLAHASHGRSLADLGQAWEAAPQAAPHAARMTAYFVDLATALGQLGLVDFDHRRRPS